MVNSLYICFIYWERDLFGLSSLLSQVPPDVIIGGGLYTVEHLRERERERERERGGGAIKRNMWCQNGLQNWSF